MADQGWDVDNVAHTITFYVAPANGAAILVKEYAQNYSGITDAQADSYIKRWVTLDGDNAQLRVKYIPEFEKVISHKKTALFFQIDRRLSMMIELQLASQVPLVKP